MRLYDEDSQTTERANEIVREFNGLIKDFVKDKIMEGCSSIELRSLLNDEIDWLTAYFGVEKRSAKIIEMREKE